MRIIILLVFLLAGHALAAPKWRDFRSQDEAARSAAELAKLVSRGASFIQQGRCEGLHAASSSVVNPPLRKPGREGPPARLGGTLGCPERSIE